MKQSILTRRIGRTIAALAFVGLASAFAVSATIAMPGDKDKDKSSDQGYLGVYMQDLTRNVRRGLDLEVKSGVLISGIVDDSPAEKAGIEDGDVIVKFDGKSVSDSEDLSDLVRDAEPGSKVKVELIRDGKKKTVTLTIAERPDDFGQVWNDFDFGDFGDFEFDMGDFSHHMRDIGHTVALSIGGPRLGIQTHELNEGLAEYFDAEEGVLVLDVVEKSVADEAGIMAGDVVTNVAGSEIENTRDIREALYELEEGDEFDVKVLRKGKTRTLKATMNEQTAHFIRRAPRIMRHHMNSPKFRVEVQGDDLRRDLDELRKELQELKRELKGEDS